MVFSLAKLWWKTLYNLKFCAAHFQVEICLQFIFGVPKIVISSHNMRMQKSVGCMRARGIALARRLTHWHWMRTKSVESREWKKTKMLSTESKRERKKEWFSVIFYWEELFGRAERSAAAFTLLRRAPQKAKSCRLADGQERNGAAAAAAVHSCAEKYAEPWNIANAHTRLELEWMRKHLIHCSYFYLDNNDTPGNSQKATRAKAFFALSYSLLCIQQSSFCASLIVHRSIVTFAMVTQNHFYAKICKHKNNHYQKGQKVQISPTNFTIFF